MLTSKLHKTLICINMDNSYFLFCHLYDIVDLLWINLAQLNFSEHAIPEAVVYELGASFKLLLSPCNSLLFKITHLERLSYNH